MKTIIPRARLGRLPTVGNIAPTECLAIRASFHGQFLGRTPYTNFRTSVPF